MNLNKVFVCGRVTKDIELKSTPGGQSVCNFSLATNRTWSDKDGKKNEDVTFHDCVAWGRTAEVIKQFSGKGCELLVEGRLQTRSWDDKTSGAKRYKTEIIAEHIQLGAKPRGAEDTRPPLGGKSKPEDETPTINIDEEVNPEDLPF